MAVNTERILQASARQIDEQAKIIRERLDEATKLLKTKFPVYLVFTHADAIEGFRDSFSTSKNEGENLVWGTTIPLEKSDNAQALFDSEYELLQDSIMKRRLMRLSAPFSPVRQLRIFNFPLHFGSARRKLGTFVTTLFRPNPFSESPFLRGFYFTAVPTDNSQRSKKPTANKGKTVGKTYFTKKFFRDVVLRDKDLVKTFQEQKQRPPIIGWLLTTFGTLLTLLIITLAGISLFSNRALVNDAAEKGDAVWTIVKSNKTKDPLSKKATEIRDEINATENLRRILVKLDKHEREGAPFYMRLGLYSGNRIYKEKLLNIYYTVIEQRYQAPVKRKIENELKQFATTRTNNSSSGLNADQIKELGEKFALLQAYLMWSGIKDKEDNYRAVPELLSKTIEPYWLSESKIPTDLHERAKAQMEFYFKQVDRRGGTYFGDTSGFPHLTQRQEVVDGARTKLKAFPPYLRYLKRVTSQVPKEIESVSVETILAGESQGAIEGTYTIPAAYTIEGYRNFIKEKLAKAEEEIGKDDWVMGDKAGDAKIQSSELAKLEDRYFNLYTDNWRQLVSNTKITSYKRQEDMDTALKAFSSTSSPMTKLLKEIARNTNFTAKPEAKGWMDFSWISDWWNSSGDKLEKGQSATVENEFGALFDFVGSGDKPKDLPISKYGADIKKVADVFTGLSPEKIKRIQRALANDDDKNREVSILKRSQKNIETKLEGFKKSAAQELAALMKQPLANVRVYLGRGEVKELGKDWEQRILPAARAIEKGYPFDNSGESDLLTVAAYLNPATGTFSDFYTKRLEKYFEESDGQLKVKDSSPVKFNPAFVTYLNNAIKLRKTLFGESPTPKFEYDFTLLPVSEAIIEVTIDGQKVTSEETGSKTLKFPAATGSSTGVLLRFSSTSGTTSTSGSPLPVSTPANNSDSTVGPLSNFLQDSEGEKRFQGAWGLFKFFDAGSPAKQPNGEYILTYKLGDKTIKATVKPKGGDLFNKNMFRSLKAPDSFLQ